jgi:hypothetical protein
VGLCVGAFCCLLDVFGGNLNGVVLGLYIYCDLDHEDRSYLMREAEIFDMKNLTCEPCGKTNEAHLPCA